MRSITGSMKGLIQLAVVAILGHGAYRIGTEYVTYYSFQDAVHEMVRFGPRDEAALREQVMDIAAAYSVPLEDQNLTVDKKDRTVHVDVKYHRAIEVLPRYPRTWRFAWAFDVEQHGIRLR